MNLEYDRNAVSGEIYLAGKTLKQIQGDDMLER
jgi:hypothetical protein